MPSPVIDHILASLDRRVRYSIIQPQQKEAPCCWPVEEHPCWKVFLAHYERLCRYVAWRRLNGDTEQAQDFIQEVAIRICRFAKNDTSGETYSFSFFVKCARNQVIDHFRSLRAKVATQSFQFSDDANHEDPVAETTLTPLEEMCQNETLDEIWAAFQKLPSRDKEAIYLKDIDGRRSREAAEMMGVPYTTFKNYLHRGRQRLRKMLPATM